MSDSTITGAICSLLPDGEGSGGVLTPAVAERLMELYPYFALPASIVLRESGGMMSHEERRRLTRHLARTAPSPVVLATLLNDSDEPFYPDEKVATPSTESAIDTFLSTYGSGGEDDEVLNRLIFNPTPDYAQLLAKEECHGGRRFRIRGLCRKIR